MISVPWFRRIGPEAAQTPQDEPLLDLEPLPAPDVIARGEAANRLLNDPVLANAFTEIRQDAFRLWIDSKPSEEARREELYRVTQALELVRGKLRAYRGAAQVKVAEERAA